MVDQPFCIGAKYSLPSESRGRKVPMPGQWPADRDVHGPVQYSVLRQYSPPQRSGVAAAIQCHAGACPSNTPINTCSAACKVVLFRPQSCQPGCGVRTAACGYRRCGKIAGRWHSDADAGALPRRSARPFQSKFADCFQHHKALFAIGQGFHADQAFVPTRACRME